MKATCKMIVFLFFLAGGNLCAQDQSTIENVFEAPFDLDVKPLNTDSLKVAAVKGLGFGDILFAAKQYKMDDHADVVDHNFPIYPLSSDQDYKLKRKALPEDYPARMPILKLKKPAAVLEVNPQPE
ncbi:hypothetical protein [Echinicola rosea]|nr:hypothetical protein [Echinicola rosea]